jgi:hypothetical protein
MFGHASSRPVQKLETDPDIAIVPCEALSKGTPEMRKNHLPSLVGGNEQMVGENAIAFSCSEAGNFHLAAGSQTFSGREELRGALWSRPGAATRPKGGWFSRSWPSSAFAKAKCGLLAAAIGMMQQRVRLAPSPDRHHQGIGDELRRHRLRSLTSRPPGERTDRRRRPRRASPLRSRHR